MEVVRNSQGLFYVRTMDKYLRIWYWRAKERKWCISCPTFFNQEPILIEIPELSNELIEKYNTHFNDKHSDDWKD